MSYPILPAFVGHQRAWRATHSSSKKTGGAGAATQPLLPNMALLRKFAAPAGFLVAHHDAGGICQWGPWRVWQWAAPFRVGVRPRWGVSLGWSLEGRWGWGSRSARR